MAATQDSAGHPKVIVPDRYVLRNTTGSSPDGSFPDLAITGVEVRGVDGGSWSMKPDPTGPKDISMTIGGLVLPEVSAGHRTPVPADVMASENDFYDPLNGRFKPILGGPGAPGMNLAITGRLSNNYVPAKERAAAQFRIAYTVSLLDTSGKPVGAYYDGPAPEDVADPTPSLSPAGS